MYRVLLAVILTSFIACKGSKQASSEESVQQEISKYLGSDYERVDQENLALCYSKPEYVGSEWKTIIVIDTQSLELLYGPEKQNTIVSWADQRVLKFADQSEEFWHSC